MLKMFLLKWQNLGISKGHHECCNLHLTLILRHFHRDERSEEMQPINLILVTSGKALNFPHTARIFQSGL